MTAAGQMAVRPQKGWPPRDCASVYGSFTAGGNAEETTWIGDDDDSGAPPINPDGVSRVCKPAEARQPWGLGAWRTGLWSPRQKSKE